MSELNPMIYAFEYHMLKALSAWLAANGINDPKKQQDSGALATPRVEVKYAPTGFEPQHYWVDQSTKEKWLDHFGGTTFVKVVTSRKLQSSLEHAALVGKCRWLMMDVTGISALMPLHAVGKLIEDSPSISVSPDDNHDVTLLSFTTLMTIRPQAFPQN